MKPERDYYAYLEEDKLDELDELELALLGQESFVYPGRFGGKGLSNLNEIAALYDTKEEWEKRAKLIRNGILSAMKLDPLPRRTPLNPVIHSKREFTNDSGKGYSVENVILEIIPGFFTTGNFYRPVPLDENILHPVALTPHGHGKQGRFQDNYQNLAITLARMGCYAMSYDMQGYNEANQVEHKEDYVGTFQTWQSMRVLDFLLGFKGADPKRVACTGNSGGGTQTFLLTALDERVKLSVPVVMVSSEFYGGCSCESGLPIHKNEYKGENYATNNAEIAAMASFCESGPRPIKLISIGHDWTAFTPKRELIFIRDIYGLYGEEARKLVENTHLRDEQHNYGPNKRQAAYEFIAKHFNLPVDDYRNEDGLVDESPNVLLEYDEQKCFTEEHPRPNHAIKGEAAILAVLEELK
ncbi:MAG: alpha/beta hydrolase family protein [Candidatus Hodarchaeota archaeon]